MSKRSYLSLEEKYEKEKELVKNIKENKELILELKSDFESYFAKDGFYRFYHQSYKVYRIQELTEKGFKFFKTVSPSIEMYDFNKQYMEIYFEGTDKKFHISANKRWNRETRPILEAFFHTKTFLDMMVEYVIEGDEGKRAGSSAWFSVLYLYGIR